MEDELDAVLKTIKTRKAASFNEIPPEVWRQGNLMKYSVDYATQYINKTLLRNRWKAEYSSFQKKQFQNH